MHHDTIPWGLLLFAGIKFIKYIADQIAEPDNSAGVTVPAEKKKEIQYLVNGTPIDSPHHVYYLQTLGLLGSAGINDITIKEATKRNYKAARELENDDCAVSDSIIAARNFLLGQWRYCTSVN